MPSGVLFACFQLPQPDDLDHALGFVTGDLQVLLQSIGGGVPVALGSGIQNFQMLKLSGMSTPMGQGIQ